MNTNEISFKEFFLLFAGKYKTVGVCLLVAWLIALGVMYVLLKRTYSFWEIALGWAAVNLLAMYLGSKSRRYEDCDCTACEL